MAAGFQVVRHGNVSSTQSLLRERARAGEDVTGVCVRADSQSDGRGRRGTAWSSAPGGSYQSIGLGRAAQPFLTLALGIGIAKALSDLSAFHVLVKWPNDLFVHDAKLGGILTEVVSGQVIAGVGVNVHNTVAPGAARLEDLEVEEVSDAVLVGLRQGMLLAEAGGPALAHGFSAVDYLASRPVEVEVAGAKTVRGRACGVGEDGALLVESDATGELVRVVSGHVLAYGASADGVGRYEPLE